MDGKMKVHAFKVKRADQSGYLADLLDNIRSDALPNRIRAIGNNELRVEDVTEQNGKWFIDFGKFREQHGPGKASKNSAIQGFRFNKGEVFCEEGACLYLPKLGYLLVQYNHYGARAGAIQEYLNCYDSNNQYSFELVPKYDETVEQKLANRAATKKVIFEIDPRFLSENDKVAGTALTQALDMGNKSGGQKIELTISAGRAKDKHLKDYADKTINALKNLVGKKPDGVTKLKVGLLDSLDSRMEVLDLIAQRLVQEFSDIPLGGDLRFPRDERYKALQKAHNGWKNTLKK